MERLRLDLEADGHTMSAVDWDLGTGGADSFIDRPPYNMEPHLKLQILDYTITSLGMNLTKGDR
jgi:hypothetical protein